MIDVVIRSMARQKRLSIPGGVYHIITRGLNRAIPYALVLSRPLKHWINIRGQVMQS
ncbi:hypothetical protein KAR34_02725 [bacterium]|nr:hypothetical protein [bacterium]